MFHVVTSKAPFKSVHDEILLFATNVVKKTIKQDGRGTAGDPDLQHITIKRLAALKRVKRAKIAVASTLNGYRVRTTLKARRLTH